MAEGGFPVIIGGIFIWSCGMWFENQIVIDSGSSTLLLTVVDPCLTIDWRPKYMMGNPPIIESMLDYDER